MNKREAVTIRATSNGYMAMPAFDVWTPEEALVFESMERLTAWVAVHFSKAEPVKAPESPKLAGCPHVWKESEFGGDRYCKFCGERRAA